MPANPLDDEEPLDPVLLRVQQRVRRLMLIGGLTLVIGITAVFLAIIYRFFIMDSNDPAPSGGQFIAGEVTAQSLGLPATAELISMNVDGDTMALAFRDGADTVTVLVNTSTMTITGQLRITGE